MDFNEDMLNNQTFPASSLSFPEMMEFLQNVEIEEVNQENVGLSSIPTQSVYYPSTNTQPSLVPFPESLTILENPPEMQQPLFCDSQGYLQANLSNGQQDQQWFLNQNMPNSFQERDISTMQQQLSNSQGFMQEMLPNQQQDQHNFLSQTMPNSFQQSDVSLVQQPSPLCYSQGYLQGNLQNIQSDQHYISNQNEMNHFQEPAVPIMREIGQVPSENENSSGYAHQTMAQPFESPNQLSGQFSANPLSQSFTPYQTYQHDPASSNFNVYDQQQSMIVSTNMEDELHVPVMVTNSPRNRENMQDLANQSSPTFRNHDLNTYTQMRPITISSTTSLQNRVMGHRGRRNRNHYEHGESSSSSQRRRIALQNNNIGSTAPTLVQERTNPPQYQNSMTPSLPPLPPRPTRQHGNMHELQNQFSPRLRNPDSQIRSSPNSFTPQQGIILGHGQRSNQNRRYENGESSASGQRRRTTLPNINVDSNAASPVQERLQNNLYDPNYESLGLYLDPHMRKWFHQE